MSFHANWRGVPPLSILANFYKPLIQIHPDPKAQPAGNEIIADIIAIPDWSFLNKQDTNYIWDAWRMPSGDKDYLWLRDDLPQYVPKCRIFIYEYEHIGYTSGVESRFEMATSAFAQTITEHRENTGQKSILLIALGCGGLVIKEALATINEIRDAVRGIAFFSTPHDRDRKELGNLVADIELAREQGLTSSYGLTSLQEGRIFRKIAKPKWRRNLINCPVISFWGALDDKVTQEKARHGLENDTANDVKLIADRRDMCRFNKSENDQNNYKLVRQKIVEMYNALQIDYQQKYIDALEEIRKNPQTQPMAMKVLQWTVCSTRPLFISELQHALALEFGSGMDFSTLQDAKSIANACAGLVVADEEAKIIRLCHNEISNFLVRDHDNLFPGDPSSQLLETCLTYLSSIHFAAGRCLTNEEFDKRLNDYPFYSYAANNWGRYAANIKVANPSILRFLENSAAFEASIQAMFVDDYRSKYQRYDDYSQRPPQDMTGLHVAAYFGIKDIAVTFLERGVDVNARDSYDRTPLAYAAKAGHLNIAELLVTEYEADPNLMDANKRTPILRAAEENHPKVVEFLLRQDIDINYAPNKNTLLWYSCANGDEATVKLLLKKDDLDVDSEAYGGSPILQAVQHGSESIVRLLLDSGKLKVHEWDWKKLLRCSISSGNVEIVKLILERGEQSPNSTDEYKVIPLELAVKLRYKNIIQLLLAHEDIEPNNKGYGDYYKTAIGLAARNGDLEMLKMLMEDKRIDPDEEQGVYCSGQRPLHFAVSNRHTAMVKFLLDSGRVDPDSQSTEMETPLYKAAENGSTDIMKLLISTGKIKNLNGSILRRYGFGRSIFKFPIVVAAANGHLETVKTLLDTGLIHIDVAGKDNESLAPLIGAVQRGDERMVRLLLTVARANMLVEPLHVAAATGEENMVRLILSTGLISPDSMNEGGQTAFFVAARYNRINIMKMLLATNMVDPNFEMQDCYGDDNTPLASAANMGHIEAVKILLACPGVDPNYRSAKNGQTALAVAAHSMKGEVIKLLLSKRCINPNLKDVEGRGVLSKMVGEMDSWKIDKNIDILKLLLTKSGINPDLRDNSGRSVLSWAAEKADVSVVDLLLKDGRSDINSQDSQGKSPLFWAVEKGRVKTVERLLQDKEIDVSGRDLSGQTILSLAVTGKDGMWAVKDEKIVEILTLLLKSSTVDMIAEDNEGRNVLSWAAAESTMLVTNFLVERFVKDNLDLDTKDHQGRTAISHAAENNKSESLLLLFKTDKVDANTTDDDKRSPLSWAASRSWLGEKTIGNLLQFGAVVDTNNLQEQALLAWAVEYAHQDIVRLLLERPEVDVNCQNSKGETPLCIAVNIFGAEKEKEKAHKRIIELLIANNKVNINAWNTSDQTLIWWALERGYEEIIRLLIERRVEVETKNGKGQTLLAGAARKGHVRTVRLLLDKGANIEAQDDDVKYTPILSAATCGNGETIKLLIDHGADYRRSDNIYKNTALGIAALYEKCEAVEVLLELDVDIEARNGEGQTPLAAAASHGPDVALMLLKKGANVNTIDNNHMTPLLVSAKNGNARTALLLLEHGADFNAKSESEEKTALMFAAAQNYQKLFIKDLLDRGADPNCKDKDQRTALHYASIGDRDDAAEILIEFGADVNLKDKDHHSALSLAAQFGNLSIVRLLLEAKDIDCESSDATGRTPLIWAACGKDNYSHSYNTSGMKQYPNVIQLLLSDDRVDVNAKDFYGRSALSGSSGERWSENTKVLVDHKGVDIDTVDNEGRSALSWAAKAGKKSDVKLLLKKGADPNRKDIKGCTPLALAYEAQEVASTGQYRYQSVIEILEPVTEEKVLKQKEEEKEKKVVQNRRKFFPQFSRYVGSSVLAEDAVEESPKLNTIQAVPSPAVKKSWMKKLVASRVR